MELPKICQYIPKKEIKHNGKAFPIIEKNFIITPWSGDSSYSEGNPITFRVILPNDKLRSVHSSASYGSYFMTVVLGNDATSVNLDGSSNCVFKKITENAQSSISDFNNQNVYSALMYDLTISPVDRMTYYSFFGNK